MSEVSNKKRKFIKRNFKHLSLEELAHHTGLKPQVVKSLIDDYTVKSAGADQAAHIKNSAGSFPSGHVILLTSLLFAAVATLIYFPSLQGDFVFDDSVIQDNPLIHLTRVSQALDLLFSQKTDRSIGLMSFALNYYFGGLHPFGYHLVNVIIHILNGVILFLLSSTLLTLPLAAEGRGRAHALSIAFLGSLLWLVHPLQTQAVSYIVQRLTSLSALFFLLSLLCYIRGRMHHARRRIALFMLSIVLGLLALGTKQNAATLPLFIILSELFFFHHKPLKLQRKTLLSIILLGGVFILIAGVYLGADFISRLALQYEQRGWTPLERVLTQLRVVIFYVSLLLYPHPSRLNLDHDFPISSSLFAPFTTFLSLLFIIGSLSLAIWIMKRNRLISYALFWFFGNLVIESSIIPLELVFEHRMYLPSMGILMLVVGVGVGSEVWRRGVIGVILVVTVLFSYWTYERAFVWREPLALWMDAVQKSPYKARPHYNLGFFYGKKGMLDKAISEYKRAMIIDPNDAEIHNNLGIAYTKKEGMLDDAISEFKKAITINPNGAKAHYNLGLVYDKEGMLDDAISECKKAIAINPNYAEAHYNLGLFYSKKGLLDDAIAEYKRALAINPNDADAHYSLGLFYDKKGMLDEAINSYREVIRLQPNHQEAHNHLAWIYATCPNASIRNGEEAVALAIKSCELTGFKKAVALDTLAAAYAEQGNFDKAMEYQYMAIKLGSPQEKKEFQNRLQLYKTRNPYRDQ